MASPVGGVDYPRTWSEFVAWFPDEAACVAYLERLRWVDGFVCPGAGRRAAGQRTSVTAGTIFAGTRTPLTQWFGAAWNLCATTNGTSALGMQKLLGLGSYETAWMWLHKLRRAMVMPGRDLLRGDVEVDETYVGGDEPGLSGGRAKGKKVLVAIAV
jgi:Transposase zinc-ribbon domain